MMASSSAIAPAAHRLDRYIAATIPQRLGALLVDILIFCVSVALPATLASSWFGPAAFTTCTFVDGSESCSITPEALRYTRTVFYALTAVWVLAYSWTISRGASIGKRATEVMVIDARTGATIGYWRAVSRTVLSMISFAAFGLGLLLIFTNRDRRAAHDYIMGTRVISP